MVIFALMVKSASFALKWIYKKESIQVKRGKILLFLCPLPSKFFFCLLTSKTRYSLWTLSSLVSAIPPPWGTVLNLFPVETLRLPVFTKLD